MRTVASPFPSGVLSLAALILCSAGSSAHDPVPDPPADNYVAGLRIPSADLYELLDPHGHEVDLTGVACNTCQQAAASDGFCETDWIGYVDGRAYVTELAYLLAKREPVEETREYARLRSALDLLDTCELCALACFANGRCPECDVWYRDGARVARAKGASP